MPSTLTIPVQRTAPPKDLEVRPKQVKAWIESLPLHRGIEATRPLCTHLAAVNRSKLDVGTRLEILENYRPFAATHLEDLEQAYCRAVLPLPQAARESLAMVRELAGELALGYRIAAADKGGKLFGGRKHMPPLLLRAMEFLWLRLQASYKSYTPAPAGSWSEMHQLYLHADQEGIAREPADAESKASVADVYLEALLASLTDPYRLAQGELDRVIAQLRPLRGLATLGQARPPTPSGGHFLVPCDTDRPPKPALSAQDEAGGPNWRLLDANPVVDRMRAKRNALETGQVSASTSKAMGPEGLALLGRLATLLGDPPKRSERREPAEGSVAICAGLRAVGHFVAHQSENGSAREDESVRRGITMPLNSLPLDDASQPIPVFEWDVVNQSAGGIKVRRAVGTPQAIGVGEVLGIKFPGKPAWTIGVVRWITAAEDDGMEFGVQFVAPAARRVWVKPAVNLSPQAKPGLLVGDDSRAPDALMTPPGTWAALREFELSDDEGARTIRAGQLIERTARFELFKLEG